MCVGLNYFISTTIIIIFFDIDYERGGPHMVSIWSTELQIVVTSCNVHIRIFVPLEFVVVDAVFLLNPDFPVFSAVALLKSLVIAIV